MSRRRKVKPIGGGRSINDSTMETAEDVEEHIAELVEDIERKLAWLARARDVLAMLRNDRSHAVVN